MMRNYSSFGIGLFQDGEKRFKCFKTTTETKIVRCSREPLTTIPEPSSTKQISDNNVIRVPPTDRKTQDNKRLDISSGRRSEGNVYERLNCNTRSEVVKYNRQYHPKGKTYRKTKYDSTDLPPDHPKVLEKIERMKRRDSKSGGLSKSSRMRKNPYNQR